MKPAAVIFVVLLLISCAAKAQVISLLPTKANVIYAYTGSNQVGTYLAIGYARTVELRFLDKLHIPFLKSHPMMFFGEFSSRTDHFGNNLRFTYGAQTDIVHKGRFRLPFKKTFYVAETRNTFYKSLSIGAGLGLLPGYYTERFSIAADIFYSHNWTTKIWDLDRNYQNEPPSKNHLTEGWHHHIGGSLKMGVIVAYKHKKSEYFIETGYQGFKNPNIANLSIFYSSFGLNYRF
ncbi:MAG: hypothetical protein EAZ08_08285 [Cytophagales bacterium]|nr:MAG: hypothetical protein EAZ08_08285 [Cytophagales bacterium]